MQKRSLDIVFLIAGSEPLGSAGMQADIKAITACGGYAACAITCIVDEDTKRVKSITPLPTELIVSQADSFLSDVGAQCIKTGVLPRPEIICAVGELLKQFPDTPLVVDPVVVNSNGEMLVSEESVDAYKNVLFPLATLITPNFKEAEVLLGHKITNIREEIKEFAGWGCSVVVKSIRRDNLLCDYLYNAETGEVKEYTKPWVDTHNVNGTGDSFSSAISTYLAKGYSLEGALDKGEEFIARAISLGAEYVFGQGFGPVHPCFMEDKSVHERIYN